jgi:hypothetical protein
MDEVRQYRTSGIINNCSDLQKPALYVVRGENGSLTVSRTWVKWDDVGQNVQVYMHFTILIAYLGNTFLHTIHITHNNVA